MFFFYGCVFRFVVNDLGNNIKSKTLLTAREKLNKKTKNSRDEGKVDYNIKAFLC